MEEIRQFGTISTTSGAQTAGWTVVIYHPNCHQCRYAWVGVRPFFRAVSYALRRRGSTTSSGRREANTRQGRRGSPRETASSTTVCWPTCRWTGSTNARAEAVASAGGYTATLGLKRLRNPACLVAICLRASRLKEPIVIDSKEWNETLGSNTSFLL